MTQRTDEYTDKKRPLTQLSEGEGGWLWSIEKTHPLYERLIDLGWTRGTPIRCERVSPLGDPIAYAIRGGVIALRRRDAREIFVSDEEGGGDGYDGRSERANTGA